MTSTDTDNTEKPFRLTQEQINTFDSFGFLHFPGLLNDCIEQYTKSFTDVFQQNQDEVINWVHEAHYNKTRQVLMQIAERSADFSAIIDDPRIDGIFSSLLGDDYIYRTSEGNIFSSDTYWHTDLYNIDYRYRHLKMLFYLDPVDENSGCLRVLPGSNHWGDVYAKSLEKNIYEPEKNYGLSPTEIPGHAVPTQPGDLIIFDYRLKHATCNSVDKRRMFTVCASERFSDEHLPDLAKLVGELYNYSGKIYQDAIVESADEARMKKLDQCLACEPFIQKAEK